MASIRLFRMPRSPFWWADMRLAGRRERVSTGATGERDARAWAERRLFDLAQRTRDKADGVAPIALGAFVRRYLFAHVFIRMKSRKDGRLQAHLLINFARWFGADKPLAGVNDDVIGKYRAAFLAGISKTTKKRRKPATWNRVVIRLRHALGWAFAMNFLATPAVRRWPVLPEPKGRPLPPPDAGRVRAPSDVRSAGAETGNHPGGGDRRPPRGADRTPLG